MALIVKDRVLETCSTSGLVDFTLTGAVTGYQRFSAIGNGNTTYYAAYVIGSNDWEVGIGTVGTSSLTRDTILSSSTGSKVNFAGNPVVWCDLPSSKALFTDSNNNATANSFLGGFTSVTASGTQIVLTAASTPDYEVTGSGGQTIKLPDATTLPNGYVFSFDNNQSSGAITVNNNSNTLVVSVPSGGYVLLRLLSNSIAAGSWDRHDLSPSNVSWSTNTFDYPGSITSATWNGSTVAYNRGGTGQSSNFVAGGIVYGSSTTALAVTAVGTTGQALLSNGASAPTWGNPTASAGGSTTQVQYNSSGALAGSANMTFNGTTLTLANDASVNGLTVGRGAGAVATNTALGSSALAANTSGNTNTAIGASALARAATSTGNTVIGTFALYAISPGNQNVAVGSNALSTSTGGQNTAVGYFALANNTTGTLLAGFGNNALNANTTGSQSVGMGANSLFNNTTASNNVGVGYNALNANTTGVATFGSITGGSGYTNGTYTAVAMTPVSGATFATYPTVTVVVSGGAVTSVTLVTAGKGATTTAATVLTVAAALIGGTGSGFSIPVGTFAAGGNNTAIGYQAGYAGSANGNTTGSNNTYIGYSALGSAATNTNEIVIGASAVGLGSNTTVIGNTSTTLTQTYGVTKSTNYTVATLPSASTSGVGAKAFVTDALAPTFGATVASGGSIAVPVYSDGTNWKVG
jgi:hypothetical protein